MTDERRLEEGLEVLYLLRERAISEVDAFFHECAEPEPEGLLRDLQAAGFLTLDCKELSLTPEGLARAEGVIRRHRLAEVLLHSVLQVDVHEAEQTACVFEHILSEDAADRVCSFLGHPSRCPHARAIPAGRCCALTANAEEHVQPLSEMAVGDVCEVVHIRPKHHTRMDRLGAYGLVPRSTIRLHQKRPSFVVQIDETDLALDADVARDIYVRRKA